MLALRAAESEGRGFTLIELILGVALIGIITGLTLSILHIILDSNKNTQGKDDTLLQGRFAVEFIRSEIEGAELIYHIDDMPFIRSKFPMTLPFVLGNKLDKEYIFVFYRVSNDTLIRTTFLDLSTEPSSFRLNGGNNNLIKNVICIDKSYYDNPKELLHICIELKDLINAEEFTFSDTFYLGNI